jgi:UDP-N-acetylmuramoylalanine--D-glutamate ligase
LVSPNPPAPAAPLIELLKSSFRGRQVTLIGLGRRTHVALARFLVAEGAQVRVSERKTAEALALELGLVADLPLDLRLGGHQEADVAGADVVFVTPDAPRSLPILEAARRNDIPISSEIELVFARCRAPIVGITGSAGKTTTTTLVGKMLQATGRSVRVGGNIGVPLVEEIDRVQPDELVVLELSSFQLEALQQSAHVGAILNVTPNHLDRHPTFEHYRDSKFNLVQYQRPGDVAVLGSDDPVAASLAERCRGQIRWFSGRSPVSIGAFRHGDELIVRDQAGETAFARTNELLLPGAHNILNVLAAAAVARAVDASPEAIRSVTTTFPGVEHRLELVRDVAGVGYYNDSIATSPERAAAALRAFDRPVVLIAGGRSKHLPWDELTDLILDRARAVVTLGEMAEEIEAAIAAAVARRGAAGHRFEALAQASSNASATASTSSVAGSVPVVRASSLADAVTRARELARPGDAVLLSPAGTSFDAFRDFEDRGQQFKAIVTELRGD